MWEPDDTILAAVFWMRCSLCKFFFRCAIQDRVSIVKPGLYETSSDYLVLSCIVSKFSQISVQILDEKTVTLRFQIPLADFPATYDVHLRLIGKP